MGVLFAVGFLSFGILAIARPDVILRWTEDAHQEFADDDADTTMLLMIRFIGALYLGFAMFFSVIIALSFIY